jgi:hypothetical protein
VVVTIICMTVVAVETLLMSLPLSLAIGLCLCVMVDGADT